MSRELKKFKLSAPFKPTGDQPKAIDQLVKNLQAGAKHQVLLGVTGSGKTFTMANVIEKTQKPTLIISHNKTLAAQLYQEFKEFFPQNSVNYFVSYYDYYQPEAYIPTTDTYIDKDAKINEELDRLRHAATQNLLERPDTIIVASVSCIYNIGLPSDYLDLSIEVTTGQTISRQALLRQLTSLQYIRQDINFGRGSFRVRGETIEIWPATGEKIVRLELKGNTIAAIIVRQTMMARDLFVKRETKVKSQRLYPAKFWVAPQNKLKLAMANIQTELDEQLKKLKKQGKILEAERLRRRTNYDLEMMKEVGYCHGIENYSRHIEFRPAGAPPYSLLDYFAHVSQFASSALNSHTNSRDFLTIIDESHMTVPQIGAMYAGDRSRKQTLIDFGFRLPSALDNRPLKFEEFEQKVNQVIYTSATPGRYELGKAKTYCTKNPPPPSPVSSTGQALKGGSKKLSPPLGGVRGDFTTIPIGPFTNGTELKQILRALRKILPYRTCKNAYNKPCLQWHLGLCPAHRNPPPPSLKGGSKNASPPLGGVRGDFEQQQNTYLNSLNTLRQLLRLYANEPIRVEAYDISNIQGTNATGSMIVFEGVKPKKSDYRRFRIKTVRGANDVAMLKEVLRRRLNHSEWPSPDLILIDGGRAQLNIANLSQDAYHLSLPLISLAKRVDELYTIYNNKTLRLNALPINLRLTIQAIRNEAHRFAISYYRKLHRRTIKK